MRKWSGKNMRKRTGKNTGKNTRNVVLTLAACALVGAAALGGTMAYLTDQGNATNAFTVGQVKIELTETAYPGNNDTGVKNLVPNQEVPKNPVVKNNGSNDALVFMTVEVPRAKVTLVADDGTKGTTAIQDLFWLKAAEDLPGVHDNHFDDGWLELNDRETSGNTVSKYVFAYRTPVAGKGDEIKSTTPLFDKVQLKNIVEDEVTAGEKQEVIVKAYAIQYQEILGKDDMNLTDSQKKAKLNEVYDIYFRQNSDAA